MADFSCPDWFEKLKAGRPPLPDGLPLDQEESRLAVQVFDMLRLPDVPGKPRLGDVAGEWMRQFVAAIFGLVVLNEDRSVIVDRHARKFLQLVPKKNGKTTEGAAIMMTAMIRNRRPLAEFILVGPTQTTALRAYEQAEGMVLADPWLKKRFHTRSHIKTIEDRTNGAKLRILSFDNKVMTGAKPVGVLIDELHELGKFNHARKVMTQIEGGILANAEGFVVIISTQSDEPPAGVFRDELEMARKIRDGHYRDGETLPMMYEFPLSMQADPDRPWADPANWPIVLPNLDRSVSIGRLVPKFREADEAGIEAVKVWCSQHLNIQIGTATAGDGWVGADYWGRCADRTLTLETLMERSEVIVAGIDGGGLDDLLGLCLAGRDRHTRDWLLWFRAWAHPDVLERRKVIAERLRDFERAGDLVICSHPTQDIIELADLIELVRDEGLLPENAGVGADPQLVGAILDELDARGIGGNQVVGISQGYRLSRAVWGMERKLKDGTLRHNGSPMMDWVVGNAKVEQRGNAVLITKQAAGKAKIDPLMAGFDAVELMSRNPVASAMCLDDFLRNPVMAMNA